MHSNQPVDAFRATEVQRVERSDGFARRLVIVVAVLLALAVAKPWNLGASDHAVPSVPVLGAPQASGSTAPAAAGSPAPGDGGVLGVTLPTGPDPDHISCYQGSEWQVVTLEHQGQTEIRSWYVVEPSPSLVGLDPPSMSVLRVATPGLAGIGLCAPAFGAAGAGVPFLGAWTATPSGGPGAPLVRLRQIGPATPGAAIVYAHPQAGLPEGGAWPAGRYVFEAMDPRGNPDRVVWLSLQVIPEGDG